MPHRTTSLTLRSFLAIMGGAFLVSISSAYAEQPANDNQETYKLLNLFGEVYERVKSDYVEEVSDKALVEAAINGMLVSLDPHSSYLPPKSFKEMQVQTRGEFGGLGIEVTMENGLVKVVTPIDDTPAARAGVESGDYIIEIDGEQVMGLTLSEAVDKMRGKVGTDIDISIVREGVSEPIKLTITRAVIEIKSVRYHTEEDIAYVRVTQFTEKTTLGVQEGIAAMRKEIGDKKLKGLVLDLRNNPGGLLDQAISLSDAFLERGEIVSTRERDPKNTRRYSAESGDIMQGLPIIVLINGGSASASEIVAGALKDHNRAVILGTKSFGKGSVQTVIPLPGYGAMRLTTARYYTPAGVSIQAKGIEPDINVEQAKLVPITQQNRFGEENLRGHLEGADEKKTISPQKIRGFTKEEEKNKDKNQDKDKEANSKDDYQLSRALDLIRAMSVYSKNMAQ